jgi:hypothetical protein
MRPIWFGILMLSWGTTAAGECRPEGRAIFTAGLEALAHRALSVAAEEFGNLVQAEPDCVEARNNLAVVQVEQGLLNEAAEELRVAVRLRPDYERARVNLQRVEALLARQSAPTPSPAGSPLVPSPTVTPEPQAIATVTLAVQPTETPALVAMVAQPRAAAAAPGIVALDPQGATACVLDPVRQRVCLYERTAEAVILRACYPFAGFRVGAWPGWQIAGDTSGRRIRLFDETGRRRLTVIPERANVGGDVVRLRQSDFDSLSASVRPWRTGWVLADTATEVEPATLAALREVLEAWRSAWEQRRWEDYVRHYSRRFVPQSDPDVAHWLARKHRLFEQAGSITVRVASPSVFITGDGATIIMLLDQRYRSGTSAARDVKALRWQRETGAWKITAETVFRPNPPE